MKYAAAALLAAVSLTGCMGPAGNPNRQPYANEPGGAMATKPETIGTVTYDPYATVVPFVDMQSGQAAVNPPPPLPLPPPNAPLRRPR